MGQHANFKIVKNKPGEPLIIRDLGPHDKFLTVTNDVEWVVEQLIKFSFVLGSSSYVLPEGRQLFYYDSDENLDEIVVKDGKFVRFEVGPIGRNDGTAF